jgi:hypothetical protein
VDKEKRIPFLPSREEIAERVEQSRSHWRDLRNSIDLENTFCPVDLGDWIELCQKAHVPYIAAEKIAEVACEDVVRFDEPGDHQERTKPFWDAVNAYKDSALASAKDGHAFEMLRWSCCAPMDVKYRLGKGSPEWHEDLINLFMIDDPRAFDIIYEFPKPTVSAYARPWVSLMIHEKYPVEFRVFVENNEIIGISSYYPQRPLPVTDFEVRTLRYVEEVARQAHNLILSQKKPLNCPELRRAAPHLLLNKNSWTADFAVDEYENILFLEGGPPHTQTFGAHPCCFAVGEIEGIALRPRKGMAGDVARVIEESAAQVRFPLTA